MTDTASSLLGCRTESGKLVASMRNCQAISIKEGALRRLARLTSVPRDALPSVAYARWTSSETSSSISVVSVPLDVTGDGPTMSLGLKRFIELADNRLVEYGLREAESKA